MNRFSDLRSKAGLSLREASNLLGIEPTQILAYERDVLRPSPREVQILRGLALASSNNYAPRARESETLSVEVRSAASTSTNQKLTKKAMTSEVSSSNSNGGRLLSQSDPAMPDSGAFHSRSLVDVQMTAGVSPDSLAQQIDRVRLTTAAGLDPQRKAELGQFMTPEPIARFMASLFFRWPQETRLLDAGAGIGSLCSAFAVAFSDKVSEKASLAIDAYEIDPTMVRHLTVHLEAIQRSLDKRGTTVSTKIHERDFIHEGSFAVGLSRSRFTHAILNPPYKKIGSSSEYRKLLRTVGVEVGNLYAAFLAVSISLMERGGEVVAIVPRSFCNGMYFRPFRMWLLDNVAIQHIHVFESRKTAFRDDAVLQENIIIHLVRGGAQGDVTVSTSTDSTFRDYSMRIVPFSSVVWPSEKEKYIHIPTIEPNSKHSLFTHSLAELGFDVSTGPVVDFRLRDHWLSQPIAGSVPLLYAHHFSGRRFEWPRDHKKPNALLINDVTRKWLLPNGWYTVTKRFSAKEERRRVVAYVVDPTKFTSDYLGLENHLNVIHARKAGIPSNLAHGLAVFLNCTIVDQHFRSFSGHTQVNATDLRMMKFPSIAILQEFGEWAQAKIDLNQEAIDSFVGRFYGN